MNPTGRPRRRTCDQPVDEVDHGIHVEHPEGADPLDRLEIERTGKGRQPGEQHLFVVIQQPVRPVDRGPQRAMAIDPARLGKSG